MPPALHNAPAAAQRLHRRSARWHSRPAGRSARFLLARAGFGKQQGSSEAAGSCQGGRARSPRPPLWLLLSFPSPCAPGSGTGAGRAAGTARASDCSADCAPRRRLPGAAAERAGADCGHSEGGFGSCRTPVPSSPGSALRVSAPFLPQGKLLGVTGWQSYHRAQQGQGREGKLLSSFREAGRFQAGSEPGLTRTGSSTQQLGWLQCPGWARACSKPG